MEIWLHAAVVVDVANLAHDIHRAVAGADRSPPRIEPDLPAVASALRRYGIVATSFEVALPIEEVDELGVRPQPDQRREMVRRSQRWVQDQRQRLGPERVHLLRGATDGNREIGVDGMCVLGAIRAAWRDDVEGVVVLSRDQDVMVAQDYAVDTPIYLAGCFGRSERRELVEKERNWIELDSHALASMAPTAGPPRGGAPDIELMTRTATPGGKPAAAWLRRREDNHQVSADLAGMVGGGLDVRERATDGAAVVAIADPYGLSLAAAQAIGVAKLPTPATIAAVLAQLGWDAPVAQLAAVPDIVDRLLAGANLDHLSRRAMEERDGELEMIIDAFRTDTERTHVTVGRLAAERTGAVDVERRRIEEKQVVTVLAADVLWALTRTGLPVVVLSDRCELTYLLEQLDDLGVDTRDRLTRVGLHARPFRPVASLAAPATPNDPTPHIQHDTATVETSHIVVLNGQMVARLVGLQRRLHGPRLLAAIHAEVADPAVAWRMVRFEAESLSAVLSPVERPEVEAVFHRMLELDCDVARELAAGDTVTAGRLGVDIHFDPGRPCAMPMLTRAPPAGEDPDIAIIAEHRDGAVHVDLDGDGDSNAVISVSHGADAYEIGGEVLLRSEPAAPGGLRLLGPVRSLPGPAGVPVVVTACGPGRATDPGLATPARLHEIPGLRDLRRRVGEHLLAYPFRDGSFQALSTALPHLQPDGPDRG